MARRKRLVPIDDSESEVEFVRRAPAAGCPDVEFAAFRSGIQCDLEVITMDGWHRNMFWEDTGLPYVLPSPNLPTPDSCVVYPGMVLVEGTLLSEGRGTTKPFELVGAPHLDPVALVEAIAPDDFDWRPPPYEYEERLMPIDILWGSAGLREGVDAGHSVADILQGSDEECAAFGRGVEGALLY
jgi:hypothetical protein